MTPTDLLSKTSLEPNLDELAREYHRSAFHFNDLVRQRKELAENTRYAQWEGQDEDGKKHDQEDKQAFPFDGASDTRIRLADQIINDNVDVLVSAFARAQPVADGIEARDAELAGTLTKALEWARHGGLPDLETEVELCAQYAQSFGWSVVHTIWERVVSRRMETVTKNQIASLIAEMDEPSFAPLPDLLANPGNDDFSAPLLLSLYGIYARLASPQLEENEFIAPSLSQAKKWARDFREEGEAVVPLAYQSRNNPRAIALKPYEEIFFPPETTDLARARVIFRVDWLSEAEMRNKVKSEGWSEDWVEQAVRTHGLESFPQSQSGPATIANLWPAENRTNMIENVWAYTRSVDEDGQEIIYCTIFSPHLRRLANSGGAWAKHEPLNYSHGQYPFKIYRRDRPERRLWSSRGVPELTATWQDEKKSQRDSVIDRTSLSVMPPLRSEPRNRGKIFRLAPGQTVFARKDETEWMNPPPGNPAEALTVIADIERDADQYFGRFVPSQDPSMAIIKRQKMVDTFLYAWVEVFGQTLALMRQFLSDEEWIQISGAPPARADFESLQRGYDWKLKFDVRELNTDFMVKKLETFVNFVVQSDRAGVIDMAKLTRVIASWVDPTIARAVIAEEGGASRQMYERVQRDFALMALGNEVQMVENDPTAQMQMQFAQQILQQNIKYQQMLQGDEPFRALVETWMKNRQQSVAQQQNKTIGRTGVQMPQMPTL